jgi:glycosyltransferase involved in cell wall biosynthesis
MEKIPHLHLGYCIRHANSIWSIQIFVMDFCILIPYYNDFEGLVYSINSIEYPKAKYCILIVDDGSDWQLDRDMLTARISDNISFEILRLHKNQGITKALNTGLAWINNQTAFRYIARLDCGDWCCSNRFYEQVNFLDEHPEVQLLGSWCVFEDASGKVAYTYRTPVSADAIRRAMHFRNVFIHPTVMWRTGNVSSYPDNFPYAEDYGLFYHIMRYQSVAIIPQILMKCKLSVSGLSWKHRRLQLASRAKVVRELAGNKILMALGILKISFLKILPYDFILQLKKRLYPI